MITKDMYFGDKDHSIGQDCDADLLLRQVNLLLAEAAAKKVYKFDQCPNTGTQISGAKGGHGDGGFRLPESTTGAAKSSHKEAKAVDVYDPLDRVDNWVTDELLSHYGLYRESKFKTPGWIHLTTRAPHSGKRSFEP
jgi:hypothetical protein